MITFKNITKTFGGVVALNDVSFNIREGECHALMGENGAGKSTLSKIIGGIHTPTAGEYSIAGEKCLFQNPSESFKKGIGMVHQELVFCGNLTIAENLSLGRYPTKRFFFSDRDAMRQNALSLLKSIGYETDINQEMKSLSAAESQMIQIAFAYGSGAKVLIFDEPTASLSEQEAQKLFALIRKLKEQRVTIIYVSHRMKEVFELSDRISVLRDGQYVATIDKADFDEQKLISLMIGREYNPAKFNKPDFESNLRVLEVVSLSFSNKFKDISFYVKAGEILGFAGLVGAGRSDVCEAIFGLKKNKYLSGQILLNGVDITGYTPSKCIDLGIALIPEDRKRQGLALDLGIKTNFSFTVLDRVKRGLFVNHKKISNNFQRFKELFKIKIEDDNQPVSSLSGGNQQKVVISKWLSLPTKLIIFDEPTKGIDIGTKNMIYEQINKLASEGNAIVLVSSELVELLNLSDRIIVMKNGKITGEVTRVEANQEKILALMS